MTSTTPAKRSFLYGMSLLGCTAIFAGATLLTAAVLAVINGKSLFRPKVVELTTFKRPRRQS